MAETLDQFWVKNESPEIKPRGVKKCPYFDRNFSKSSFKPCGTLACSGVGSSDKGEPDTNPFRNAYCFGAQGTARRFLCEKDLD